MGHHQGYMDYCRALFWSESFWFTHNSSWKDLEDQQTGPYKDIIHPQFSQLYAALGVAVVFVVTRILLELLVLNPIADKFGLQQRHSARIPKSVPLLDKFFRKIRRPSEKEIVSLASKLNWTTRQVERWFRVKRNFRKSSVRSKFCEAGWRFCFYLAAFALALFVLRDQEFAYDWSLTRDMGTWPHHHVKAGLWLFYVVEIGFYLSLFASLMTDVRRSDFVTMTVHHVLTIVLLVFSWTINFTRVGIVIVVLHDSSDYWLEAAKLCLYLKKESIGSTLFVIFLIIWMATRVYLYPIHIVVPSWQVYFEWYRMNGHFPAVFCLMSFLLVIVVLNMIWTYHILRTLWSIFYKSDVRDDRSGSELSELSSDENQTVQNGHNGCIKNKND